jgi:hypothetical protein
MPVHVESKLNGLSTAHFDEMTTADTNVVADRDGDQSSKYLVEVLASLNTAPS